MLVDDGSTDDTFALLAAAVDDDPRFRIVRLRRNFGQTAALAAGIDHATGGVIVTMDGDLQNDPADIPRLLAMLDAGYDVVTGWRKDRKDPFLSRQLPSIIANAIIGATTQVRIHDHGCGLKAFRAEVAKSLKLYGEMHRFITAIAGDLGANVVEIPVHHRPRTRGTSKYGISRTIRVVLDLLTIKFLSGYSTRPIHVFGFVGMLATIAGVAITGVLGFERIFLGVQLADRPLLLLGLLLVLGGVQLVTLGLLGEMLARTYHESQAKPIYMVREVRQSVHGVAHEKTYLTLITTAGTFSAPPAEFAGQPLGRQREALCHRDGLRRARRRHLLRRKRQRRHLRRHRRGQDRGAAEERRPDLRARPRGADPAQHQRAAAHVHDRSRRRGARVRDLLHRGRHAGGARRLGGSAGGARRRRGDRRARWTATASSSARAPCRSAPPTRCAPRSAPTPRTSSTWSRIPSS